MKCLKLLLIAISTRAFAALGLSGPALANDECGPLVGDSATCTPAGNPYPTGVNYDTNNGLGGTPINLTLLPGVNVVIPFGIPSANAVCAANTAGMTPGSANISMTADHVNVSNISNPLGNHMDGLRIQSSGNAVITATNTTVDVAGTAAADAISAIRMPDTTGRLMWRA